MSDEDSPEDESAQKQMFDAYNLAIQSSKDDEYEDAARHFAEADEARSRNTALILWRFKLRLGQGTALAMAGHTEEAFAIFDRLVGDIEKLNLTTWTVHSERSFPMKLS